MNLVQRLIVASALMCAASACDRDAMSWLDDVQAQPAGKQAPQQAPAPDRRDPVIDEGYTEAANRLTVVKLAIDKALIDRGTLPASLDTLVAEGRIASGALVDSWGARFSYRVSGATYSLCSAGPDRQAGNADDICH